MPELFPQQLKANFTPDQQDYYSQLENELKEILGDHTQEEIVAERDPEIIKKILEIKQRMLNFVLTKKTRGMVRQEEKEQEARMLRQREEELEKERQAVSFERIAKKHFMGQELSDVELKYLYNIDDLGLSVSSADKERERVEFIIGQRNIKKDVARALGCSEHQISLTREEFLQGVDIVYHYGELFLSLDDFDSIESISLPQYVNGDFYLGKLGSISELRFPEYIGGAFQLIGLAYADKVKFPHRINGWVHLNDLKSAKGIEWPQKINGTMILYKLMNGEGLEIPQGTIDVILQNMKNDKVTELKQRFPELVFIKI